MAQRGEGASAIAKQLGCTLDDYKDIASRAGGAGSGMVLVREIKARGYAAGISQLKAWIVPF